MVLRRTIRNSHPFVLGTRPAVALGYQMIRVIQRAADSSYNGRHRASKVYSLDDT